LQVLVDSAGILLIGSDDPSYTASKLYPCILARKPIFGIFREESSVVEILRRCNAGRILTFNSNDDPADLRTACAAHLGWLVSQPETCAPDTDWAEFAPFTAREMTRKQCEIFDRSLLDFGVR